MASSGDFRSGSGSGSPAPAGPLPRGRTCLCAPTTHRGSFRCGLHRGWRRAPSRGAAAAPGQEEAKSMAANGAESMRELLMQIVIRPSRQDLCRRKNFQPKPTRFSTSVAGERSLAVV
ncbi:unnamed protein product [Spirodela intermedia]|uniref:Uncharacterized protein n=1 Tax=Spirodela intermedia TaxID=51605 RepID=A0A7I8LDF2_SPIIN|nr:unnamed protein product [Spirodela intermedia]